MQIRTATLADCRRVAALVTALSQERGNPLPDADAVLVAAEACVTGGSELLVADADGEIVGYVAVHRIPFPLLAGQEAYVSDLVVAESWRGKGVGTGLLDAAVDRAAERGCLRLTLNNRITSEAFIHGFFTRAGFRQRTEFANFVKLIGPPR